MEVTKMKKIYIGLITLTLIGLLMLSGCVQTPQQKCVKSGGVYITEQIGGHLDLSVRTTEDCKKWGGSCGQPRIISSFTIGSCSADGIIASVECWRHDIFQPTCLIPK